MRLIISPTKVNKLLIWLNFNRYLNSLLDWSPRCFHLLIPLSAEQMMHPSLLLGKVCLPAVFWLGRLRAQTSIGTSRLLQALAWDAWVGTALSPPAQPKGGEPGSRYRLSLALSDRDQGASAELKCLGGCTFCLAKDAGDCSLPISMPEPQRGAHYLPGWKYHL